MGKWLAAGGVALIIVLVVLWKQLDFTATAAPVVSREPVAEVVAPAPSTPAPKPAEEQPAPVADVQPGKMDPASDEFFYKFEEMVVPRLTRHAVKCYDDYTKSGRPALHRNQNLVLGFKHKIVNGQVTVHDVYIKKSSISHAVDTKRVEGFVYDPALEACFIQQIRNAGWKDDRLPDMDLEDDEIVLSPGRGMKKYMRDNIEYVGAEGPKWGPDGRPMR
jgi:hypothetical protein